MNNIRALLKAIEQKTLDFQGVIAHIDKHYKYTPTRFVNGTQVNEQGENTGSCKVFGLAKYHNLSQADTLKLFCEHYEAVLANRAGHDHPNIRNFLHWGWQGFLMQGTAIQPNNQDN